MKQCSTNTSFLWLLFTGSSIYCSCDRSIIKGSGKKSIEHILRSHFFIISLGVKSFEDSPSKISSFHSDVCLINYEMSAYIIYDILRMKRNIKSRHLFRKFTFQRPGNYSGLFSSSPDAWIQCDVIKRILRSYRRGKLSSFSCPLYSLVI